MVGFGKAIVKARYFILILGFLLLIPSVYGMISTRVNYDMLDYLPKDIETMKGQDILLKEFKKGAFSMVMVEGMKDKDVEKLKEKIENVDHVDTVIWYDTFMDLSFPKEFLPKDLYEAFNNGDTTLMAVFFDKSVSADETLDAISEIRNLNKKQCFVSGMSAFVTDLKYICETEEPIYIAIAATLSAIVLSLFMDSFLLPVFFLLGIGMTILYNLGSNVMFGEISFITKALSSILQLGVTMDYSIFLAHSYEEQKERFDGDNKRAMAHAISNTFTSVAGGSVTTIAGFLALCFMSFTLGKDLGLVMAKGVVFGVIGCVTILPSFLLIFDKAIKKTSHKPLIPPTKKLAHFITKHASFWIVLFLIILGPAVFGYFNTEMYYKLDEGVPDDLDCKVANTKLLEKFDMNCTHMILADGNMKPQEVKKMSNEIEDVDGVKQVLGLDANLDSVVPRETIPKSIKKMLKSDNYQLLLVNSQYENASDEVNNQIGEINKIIKKYDEKSMLIGEAPCTKDLISIMANDFKVVDLISIGVIFVIILIVLKSISLPVILVTVIEFAIFINLGIPCYTHTLLPFIATICISTIQLGATVDYAILMTTRYKKERNKGNSKKDSINIALENSIPSIIVSGLVLLAATLGVGLYSRIDMISAICKLMARGAIISMISVILVLPSMFVLFDKIVCATSAGMKQKKLVNKS